MTTLAVRFVERAAAAVSRRGFTRRGFLYRSALVGSALTVNPFEFVLKPVTAYASVCGEAASCNGGWSAFCCTVNGGANTCPDGSYVAGWWKVDDSAFCLGENRYYIDCNRLPEASCDCHCADGPCDKRRACCNNFRYGQCNTQIAGVTEVVCRIVTCTPPWEWDPSCNTTVRTAEATRTHTASCLPGTNPSHIDIRYQDLGMVAAPVGRPVAAETDAVRGGRMRRYANGVILWAEPFGAHQVYGPLADRYAELGYAAGPVGYPTTDPAPVGDGRGELVELENGVMYRTDTTGAWEVFGATAERYARLGGPAGALGYPTAGQVPAGPDATVASFEHGAVYASEAIGTVVVTGRILEAYRRLGGPVTSGLGLPVSDAAAVDGGGRLQRYEYGVITDRDHVGARAVRGEIAARYLETGGPAGPWGFVTADQSSVADGTGETAGFQHAAAWWTARTGVHVLDGVILDRYRAEGAATGRLGYPTTDVFVTPAGVRRADLEHGAIEVHAGVSRVVVGRETRTASDLGPTADGTARPTRSPDDLP